MLARGDALTSRDCPAGDTFPQRRLGKGLVSYHLTRDVWCADYGSCEGRDDDALGEAAECCCCGSADSGEVVSIGSGGALDCADVAQPAQLPGEACGGELAEERAEVCSADAGDVDPGVLQGVEQGVVDRIEEVDALDGLAFDRARLGEPVEGTGPG